MECKSILEMITKILHIIIALWAISLACASCSQEDISQPVSIDGDGQVKIVYKIAGSSLSRATESGWGDEDSDGTDEWHENRINRIDLFVFNHSNNVLFKHIASGSLNVDAKTEQTFTQNELTYNDVTTGNYIYYMVANCEFDDNIVEGSFTLEDLKKRITPALTFNDKQTSFAMDGKIENVPTPVGNAVTLSFELKRAAVKIRISVKNKSQTSIIQDCQFQLFNYVESGTSVLNEAEAYGEVNRRESMSALTGYSQMLPFDEKQQVVFYSYPNDWFDEGRVKEYEDDEGNKNGNWVIDNYVSEIPIIGNKQTYILLKAPFNNNEYYYKVPVNYMIYENNDAIWFTGKQIEAIHDLYRIKRNHIYDITVTIDREGGSESEPVTPTLQYQAISWEGNINNDVTFE